MVFSSAIFLFCFLPAVFLLYRLPFGRRWQNILLAAASLVFYAFGNLNYVPLFLASVLLNYVTGRLLAGRFRRSSTRRLRPGASRTASSSARGASRRGSRA